ncbi:uncharacterized protein LOC103710319 [Phoenix dactylifera]|uniref:Uncharacterized protein LOC103710319 n=1 Tax=Phoenix dactylifera TaxID=42345 RepID=A0A8B9AAK0_PHODC|nr:uncharacterized protein LOC103710319 [Phoenix dactylifera]XP_038982746.1 uncharacterized protein LOC103710319 [Phoenix dactylifera]XP_038982747.1 uncharacterized protein LOC103710319 [Phoenix dactylifera]
MGQDVALKCENHLQTESRPKIVHPSHCSTKVEERDTKGQPTSRYRHLKSLDGDFKESGLSYSPSLHCKSMPSGPIGVDVNDNEVVKRGSIYQSSKEVRRIRKLREGRRKVELASYDDGAFLSFEIVASLPEPRPNGVDTSLQQNLSSLVLLNAEPASQSGDTSQSVTKRSMEFLDLSFRDLPEEPLNPHTLCSAFAAEKNSSGDNHLEICLHSEDADYLYTDAAPELVQTSSFRELSSNCNQMLGPENNENIITDKERIKSLSKSLSAKAENFSSSCQSLNASPKNRFSPFKRMLDPIMKSKSMRNPPVMETETPEGKATHPASIRGNGLTLKSLLNDFSKVNQKIVYDGQLIGNDQILTSASSPAHLHGILKLESKNGTPSFEFSIKDPADVLSAKTWRTDNAFNWVYTFHSCKKKINNTGRGTKDRHVQSSQVVGQMQVSCYLCSEVRENGSLDNSTVTEFSLYHIAQARSFVAEERSKCSSGSIQPPTDFVSKNSMIDGPLERSNSMEHQLHVRHAVSSCDSHASTSYPWSPADLHPHLEIAAIVIQIPFNKKKKDMIAEVVGSRENSNLSNVIRVDQGRETMRGGLDPGILKVVIPSGTHGLPSTDEAGPSSLLDRWRFGGGCDCGGWDMGCPIIVLGNAGADGWADYITMENQKPMALFVQGTKEKLPAVSMMADGKGQYSVDFHAQLSALQAFSICIALLHSSEVSLAVGHEKNSQRLYSNSLKLLLEEEVRHLVEAVAVEEKRKAKKKVEQIPPSFFLDPPFSPMGRV